MRRRATGLAASSAAVVVMLMTMVGCASPPAVEGLIQTAEQVIADERAMTEANAERALQAIAQQRDNLEAGFEADLQQRDSLDEAWIMRGVRVYVDARETLTRHEAELTSGFETRRRKLELAGEALSRARMMLAQQDGLFERVPDVRRWLAAERERYEQEVR